MTDALKRQAAQAALSEIRDGMIVGLGSGSTAALFIRELGGAGLNVTGIPTSEESRRIAVEAGIPLTTLADHPSIDVTVDGADEVSPALDMIKGLGAALVQEKIVARATKRVVIVVDESKLVEHLGDRTVIPVEVIPLAAPVLLARLENSRIRESGGRPVITDNGNLLIDWKHGRIDDPPALEQWLKSITGVVDSGIFAGVANFVIVAGAAGLRRLSR
jgi:ribose 5-phosphate isomerase A